MDRKINFVFWIILICGLNGVNGLRRRRELYALKANQRDFISNDVKLIDSFVHKVSVDGGPHAAHPLAPDLPWASELSAHLPTNSSWTTVGPDIPPTWTTKNPKSKPSIRPKLTETLEPHRPGQRSQPLQPTNFPIKLLRLPILFKPRPTRPPRTPPTPPPPTTPPTTPGPAPPG